SGLFHVSTERPVLLFIPKNGGPIFYVPQLELEEANRIGTVEDVRTYFEYPGEIHPLVWMAEDVQQKYKNLNHLVIDGTGPIYDILAESLSPISLQSTLLVAEMRLLKDEAEIELLTHAAKYGDAIVRY